MEDGGEGKTGGLGVDGVPYSKVTNTYTNALGGKLAITFRLLKSDPYR